MKNDWEKELLLELFKLYQDFLEESEAYDGAEFWGNSRVIEIIKQLNDQAKADQKEEDAQIAEASKDKVKDWHFDQNVPVLERKYENDAHYYREACDDIAKAIRGK